MDDLSRLFSKTVTPFSEHKLSVEIDLAEAFSSPLRLPTRAGTCLDVPGHVNFVQSSTSSL